MNPSVIVQATLKPDGTLELDQKPNLSPGRVQVVVQPLPQAPTARRGLADVMADIRQGQRARGYLGRTPEEMLAEEAAGREEDENYERRCS